MAGRPLAITQRQIRALAKGAKDAGCIAEVVIGNTLVRLVPEDRVIPDREKEPVDVEEDFVP